MKWSGVLGALSLLVLAGCNGKVVSGGANSVSASDGFNAAYSAPGLQSSEDIERAIASGDFQALVRSVYFDFDRSKIRDDMRSVTKGLSEFLLVHTDVNIVLEGHTDVVGTREYNRALGLRRANSVKEYLVSTGIDASRISVVSYGKDKPLVPEGSGLPQSQIDALNRCVEAIKLLK